MDERGRYVHMNKMLAALDTDPDLSEIPTEARSYVATGCDYTSFFNGLESCSWQHSTNMLHSLQEQAACVSISHTNTQSVILQRNHYCL